jgi:hypothetical protein
MTISEAQKRRIDNWIKTDRRNPYGDDPTTVYPTGDPLFDPRTGQMRDLYEYILSRHPELREN